ncbi:hypothetical protein [Endozoicomonas ascidiicola]|uniref:hypothetical protein n=1 Tax=Endozoicomonas ascidiicola TaxID=1698521 RepID=UPI000836DEBB|nr:hypothetical protein [Endozoicomonas ascidiicola]
MDLATFTNIFSGSATKPMNQHRKLVLDALFLLSQRFRNQSIDQSQWHQKPQWIADFPVALEKYEQEILSRLNQPTLTAQPKGLLLSLLQTQNNLAHLICRLAERLTYRPIELTESLEGSMDELSHYLYETMHCLRLRITKQDQVDLAGFKKQHIQAMDDIHHEIGGRLDALKVLISQVKSDVFQSEGKLDPLDSALLLLSLEDLDDLTFWVRSLIIHIQQL